jgi:hypothetical protein
MDFYSVKTTVHVAPFEHNIMTPEQTSLCFHSMMCAL